MEKSNPKESGIKVLVAFIGAAALITGAVIGILSSQASKRLEIHTTQTAEVRLTEMVAAQTQAAVDARYPINAMLNVFTAAYPFDSTFIRVETGDRLEITVLGTNPTWNCGRGTDISPMGYLDGPYEDLVFISAKPCALIGSITSSSPESYFFVGEHYLDESVVEPGILFLGCNDSVGLFYDNPTDSRLTVQVVVTRPDAP
jgi:hypothetical protein